MFSILKFGQSLLARSSRSFYTTPVNFYSDELSKEETELIKESWKMAEKKCHRFMKNWFNRLFKINPEYAFSFSRFGETPKEIMCNEKFLKDHLVGNVMLSFGKAVRKIDDPCESDAVAKEIGKKHIKYCVTKAHFKSSRKAFLFAMKKTLGDELCPDGQKAWRKGSKVIFKGLIKGLK